jgi:hypothetical protein
MKQTEGMKKKGERRQLIKQGRDDVIERKIIRDFRRRKGKTKEGR